MAGTNLNFYSGETLSLSLSCKDENGNTFPLSGYTARAQVRTSPTSTAVVLDLSPTIPTGGIILISKTDEQTLVVPAGSYYWDCVLDTPTGGVIFIAGGTMKFRKMVTKTA